MSFADEARRKIAKRKADEEAMKARDAELKAARKEKEAARFASALKPLLPNGVELLTTSFYEGFYHGKNGEGAEWYGKIHVGGGVEFF